MNHPFTTHQFQQVRADILDGLNIRKYTFYDMARHNVWNSDWIKEELKISFTQTMSFHFTMQSLSKGEEIEHTKSIIPYHTKLSKIWMDDWNFFWQKYLSNQFFVQCFNANARQLDKIDENVNGWQEFYQVSC